MLQQIIQTIFPSPIRLFLSDSEVWIESQKEILKKQAHSKIDQLIPKLRHKSIAIDLSHMAFTEQKFENIKQDQDLKWKMTETFSENLSDLMWTKTKEKNSNETKIFFTTNHQVKSILKALKKSKCTVEEISFKGKMIENIDTQKPSLTLSQMRIVGKWLVPGLAILLVMHFVLGIFTHQIQSRQMELHRLLQNEANLKRQLNQLKANQKKGPSKTSITTLHKKLITYLAQIEKTIPPQIKIASLDFSPENESLSLQGTTFHLSRHLMDQWTQTLIPKTILVQVNTVSKNNQNMWFETKTFFGHDE